MRPFLGARGRWDSPRYWRQLVEQRLRLVDLGQRLPGLVPPILLDEQPCEAHGRAELERFFAPAAGQLDRRADPRLAVARPATPRDQLAVDSVYFRRIECLSIGLADRGESATALLQAACGQTQLRENADREHVTERRATALREQPRQLGQRLRARGL